MWVRLIAVAALILSVCFLNVLVLQFFGSGMAAAFAIAFGQIVALVMLAIIDAL